MTTVNKVITLFGEDEEEGNNPFVVSFDSVPQAEIIDSTGSKRNGNARITCYERPQKRVKKAKSNDTGNASDFSDSDSEEDSAAAASDSDEDDNIDVVAETMNVIFHGTTSGRTTLSMRHAIGIKDAKSGKITLVEVPPVVALHKFMKLDLHDMEEDIAREAGTKIEMSEYMKYKNNLTEVFGNHKKKLQIRAATANALPDKISDITESEIKQTQAVIDEKLKEADAEADTNARDLPHINDRALTSEEAYPLTVMFFPDVLDIVYKKADELKDFVREGPMAFMHQFADICPQVSVYGSEIIKNISNLPKEKLRNVITSLVLYNYIVTFYQLPLKDTRTKGKLTSSSEKLKIPKEVFLSFASIFLEKDVQEGRPVLYHRTKLSILKMRNFMAVLALRIEDFALDPKSINFIARDFGVQVPAAVLNFERIGSSRKKIPGKESSSENYRWTLPVPVKPKVRVIRGGKAKKKTF